VHGRVVGVAWSVGPTARRIRSDESRLRECVWPLGGERSSRRSCDRSASSLLIVASVEEILVKLARAAAQRRRRRSRSRCNAGWKS